MKDLKHIKRFNETDENLNISDVMNSKINESISVKDRLNKIERIKKEYGSESNQYIIIALNEITSILRDYFNVDEIEDDGPGGVYEHIEEDQPQQKLIELLENQIMDLTVMSKIELGDDVIAEIKRLKGLINGKGNN